MKQCWIRPLRSLGRLLRRPSILLPGFGLLVLATSVTVVSTQGPGQDRRGDDRRRLPFTRSGGTAVEPEGPIFGGRNPTEAPAGFDGQTNGMDPQGDPFDTLDEDNVVPLRSFNDNRFIFEEAETVVDGLGPTYNAQSCRECHQNVVTGGASQVAEHRTGHMLDGQFFESLGGSLVHSRATAPEIVEVVDRRGRRPHLPRLDQHPRQRLRRIGGQQHAAGDPGDPAGRDSRHRGGRAGAREARHDPPRTLRLEEPARQPRVVLGRCLPERDGHHHAALPRREHLERPRRDRLRPGARPRGRRRGRGGVRQLHALDQGAGARSDHPRRAGRRGRLQPRRLQLLPRAHAGHRPGGNPGERRRLHGAAGARAARSSIPTATS